MQFEVGKYLIAKIDYISDSGNIKLTKGNKYQIIDIEAKNNLISLQVSTDDKWVLTLTLTGTINEIETPYFYSTSELRDMNINNILN